MLNIKEKPYELLVFTAIFLFLTLAIPPITHTDFKDQTMFRVPLAIMGWLIPLLLISIWLLYLLTKRFHYSLTITRIHVILTVSTSILIAIFLYAGINPLQLSSQSYYDRHELIGNSLQILLMIFVFSQFTFLANILLGHFKKT